MKCLLFRRERARRLYSIWGRRQGLKGAVIRRALGNPWTLRGYNYAGVCRHAPESHGDHQAGYARHDDADAEQCAYHPLRIEWPMDPDQDTQKDGHNGIHQDPAPARQRAHVKCQHQSNYAIYQQEARQQQRKCQQAASGMHEQVNTGDDIDNPRMPSRIARPPLWVRKA